MCRNKGYVRACVLSEGGVPGVRQPSQRVLHGQFSCVIAYKDCLKQSITLFLMMAKDVASLSGMNLTEEFLF